MSPVRQVQRGEMFAGYHQLETIACWKCGVLHALPARLLNDARADPALDWYCPNGHCAHFPGETEEDKLRKRLDRVSDRAARLAAERDQATASARAYKGVATRTRKRAKEGVCPCCNRTFKELARHMKTQHPDFGAEV